MIQYNRICIVDLIDKKGEIFSNQVILTNDKGVDNGFEVALTDDCWFVCEFRLIAVNKSIAIRELEDVYNYCRNNDITIDSKRISASGLLVGGEADFLIDNNLNGIWVND